MQVNQKRAEVAKAHGLTCDEADVKEGFKKAYKKWETSHPLYGKLATPPLTPAQWWTAVIVETFLSAGVARSDIENVSPKFTNELVERFWSRRGFTLHDDVIDTLTSLSSLVPLPSAVVSNSDPALVKVLKDLDIVTGNTNDQLSRGSDYRVPERNVFTTWELERRKNTQEFWEQVLQRMNDDLRERHGDAKAPLTPGEVLVVGDELVSDVYTPTSIGMKALLLRRQLLPQGEHARASYSDEAHPNREVQTISDLRDVVKWIRESQT